MALESLELAEDPSYAFMMIAQYTQQKTFKIEWTSQKKNLVLTHAPTAKYLYNIGSAMHEKLLNLTGKTCIDKLSPGKTHLYTEA